MARSKTRTGKPSTNSPEATSVAPVEAAVTPVASFGENGKSQAKSQSRPEIVKAAPRPSVVPFSLEEEIRRRAFELYTQRGASSGSETDDWLVAEREILDRYQEHRA
ncbi:MAG: DUF2934 domain-containing protein [Candidatus Sulfotelmatobacter sp.]